MGSPQSHPCCQNDPRKCESIYFFPCMEANSVPIIHHVNTSQVVKHISRTDTRAYFCVLFIYCWAGSVQDNILAGGKSAHRTWGLHSDFIRGKIGK